MTGGQIIKDELAMERNFLISAIIMQPSFWSQRTLPTYSELGTMKEGSHI